MIKRLGAIVAPLAMVMMLASCAAVVSGTQVSQDGSEQANQSEASTPPSTSAPAEPPLSAIFASTPTEFLFSSGAGGWSTVVKIAPDGTFTGHYEDGDMGDTGPTYPGGTVHQCDFTGQFEVTAKVSNYEYTLNLVTLDKAGTDGDQSVKDGILYVTVDNAYGMEGGSNFALYLPGRPTDDLSQGFLEWAHGPLDWEQTPGGTLSFWALYNVGGDYGLVGMD